MNQSSSRSHSIFTVHLIKSNEEGASLSKFSLVDLAGSERYRNTNSTGQRLKEAGNINKSLMVLGQCMEVLRINQIKADMGKNAALVPFRHSKLTELFKSTFEGDGKAVIVVNVNPFDTGYDENIHVMRFAAVAKDVMTSLQPSKKQKDLMAQLEDLWDKWADAETRASTIEHEVREQMETELKKTHDLYLAALKRETDMMQSHINDRLQDTPDDTFLTMLQERQTVLSKELDDINIKIKQQQDTMRDRINQLEKERNLLLEHPKQRAYNPSEDEQEPEHKENQDLPTYHQFLDLRKQLRRLIFKKEELCKDADLVMKQVEQFEGVTFQMAKETKMGKLLKLIAQEEFKSDPFYIKNRAIRLFKRYAQLPCPKQPLYDNESANDLEAENVRLKQKIKLLQYNQRRLQEELDETPAMMEDDDEKENEDTSSFNDEEDIAQLFRPKGVKRRSYSRSVIRSKVQRHSQLDQMYISLKNAKTSWLTRKERRREKKPQDGKTNPME
ncbi:hypothetical protein CU098_007075 [Rhizopus stolonifer]|uniref:Kinesin-like protein n=1 Tax=Rhizopus stolonifer TaxID=4846 RepID=A0A367JET8_RHIST|nr:hypothetical protein CU098_007075 [Rhizopus stolonifer]